MNGTFFFIFGIMLVASALAVAFAGLRFPSFPPTRLALAGVIAWFAVLVGATTTFAVLHARDDQRARKAEAAAGTTGTTSTTAAPPGKATTVKLAAAQSQIAYDTTKLAAKAGSVAIDFTNPSPLTHDVCIEDSSGNLVGCSPMITNSSTSLTESLKSGTYTFYCSVDSHRQAGMQGTLTVK